MAHCRGGVAEYCSPGSVLVFATYIEALTSDVGGLYATGPEETFSRLDDVELSIVLFKST